MNFRSEIQAALEAERPIHPNMKGGSVDGVDRKQSGIRQASQNEKISTAAIHLLA